ncbi:MAG: hypothetical protein WKF30_01735 [Pyrinomonadaceae bacterium]
MISTMMGAGKPTGMIYDSTTAGKLRRKSCDLYADENQKIRSHADRRRRVGECDSPQAQKINATAGRNRFPQTPTKTNTPKSIPRGLTNK